MKNIEQMNTGLNLAQNVYISLTNAVGASQAAERQKHLTHAQDSFNELLGLLNGTQVEVVQERT